MYDYFFSWAIFNASENVDGVVTRAKSDLGCKRFTKDPVVEEALMIPQNYYPVHRFLYLSHKHIAPRAPFHRSFTTADCTH